MSSETKTPLETKDQREALKNQAVAIREAGNLQEALELFQQVEAWDEAHQNLRGQVDVLGHMRITYTRLADQEADPQTKHAFRLQAVGAVDKAKAICDQHDAETIPQGPRSTLLVHASSSRFDLAVETEGAESTRRVTLEQALADINQAMETLPGSKANKAWPANTKGKILFELGRVNEAVEVLTQAQAWIFEGYEDELKKDDQAYIKLNVWQAGLTLTLANICAKTGRPIQAKQYATSVLTIEDPTNTLGERKKEAQRILDQLTE
jgi:tetratricopeptide (TPR) repeat protein